jgi:CheY-like chemotaxis protein
VENLDGLSILVFERREMYVKSVTCTLENLGVCYTSVKTADDFHRRLTGNDFTYAFVASPLYDVFTRDYPNAATQSIIVLIEDFGDDIPHHGFSVLSTPIYTINVANLLNGGRRRAGVKRFTAPDARVLVVDDIYTNLQITAGFLSPYGIQADICLSGEEAVTLVQKNKYDLVLMDHMMPDLNGIETTNRIRAMDGAYYQKIPVIALTANAASDIRTMLLVNGMNDYLAKPIDTARLNGILLKWLPKEVLVFGPDMVKAPTPGDTAGFTVEGLDVARGIGHIGGTLPLYQKTLAVFADDSAEKITNIRNCLAERDTALYTIHLHALKGVLASIGALRLSETAKKLEEAGGKNDMAFISEHTPPFLTALAELVHNVRVSLPKPETAPTDKGDFFTLLDLLSRALADYDFEAIQTLTGQLQGFNAAAAVIKAVLISEYDEARTLIGSLLAGKEKP